MAELVARPPPTARGDRGRRAGPPTGRRPRRASPRPRRQPARRRVLGGVVSDPPSGPTFTAFWADRPGSARGNRARRRGSRAAPAQHAIGARPGAAPARLL